MRSVRNGITSIFTLPFSSAPSTPMSLLRISRLQSCVRRIHTTSLPKCSADPEFFEDSPERRPRVWPVDPRGEEIRTAKARRLGINVSHRKLNLVAKLVRTLHIEEARRQLIGCNKKTTSIVMQTIDTAVTNARVFGLREDRLIVEEAFVGKGKYLKRIRPWHGKGRFGVEHKKYAHLTVKVRELDEELWEAKVLPQYVHVRRSNRVHDDANHPVRSSPHVSWVSDLDAAAKKTRESIVGLQAALEASQIEMNTTSP